MNCVIPVTLILGDTQLTGLCQQPCSITSGAPDWRSSNLFIGDVRGRASTAEFTQALVSRIIGS